MKGLTFWKLAALLLFLILLAFLVPSPNAFAEEIPEYDHSVLPQFEPVTLESCDPLPLSGRAPYAASESGYAQEGWEYRDASLYVKVYEFRVWDTTVQAAYVQIADASQLRTEQAGRYPSKTTARGDAMAKRSNAVIAVNADYFIYHNAGIVYRGGERLRNHASADFDELVVDTAGNFHMLTPLTQEGFDAIEEDILVSFCFGPALVVDGEVQEITDRRVTYKSRCGIAQLGELTYLLVVTDGDSPGDDPSTGLSIPQFAQLMKDLGAVNAYNLDGGLSVTMVFGGSKINGNVMHHRPIGDIVYFATAVPDR